MCGGEGGGPGTTTSRWGTDPCDGCELRRPVMVSPEDGARFCETCASEKDLSDEC